MVMIAINLVPVAPLDGKEAWRLFPLLWKRRKKDARRKELEAELLRLQAELEKLEKKAQKPPEEQRPTYLN